MRLAFVALVGAVLGGCAAPHAAPARCDRHLVPINRDWGASAKRPPDPARISAPVGTFERSATP